jgi:hypothetical protein
MNRCKEADFMERTKLLRSHYNYDHSSFIDQLIRLAYESPVEDLFSSLVIIARDVTDID